MAEITISSRYYRQQLVDLYYGDVREFVVQEGYLGGFFFFTLDRECLDIYGITEMFEDIVLSANAALAGSPKLYEQLREMVFSTERAKIALELDKYFQTNRELCVEGYLNFRLSGAVSRVNRALYSLAKRCLSFEKRRIEDAYDY